MFLPHPLHALQLVSLGVQDVGAGAVGHKLWSPADPVMSLAVWLWTSRFTLRAFVAHPSLEVGHLDNSLRPACTNTRQASWSSDWVHTRSTDLCHCPVLLSKWVDTFSAGGSVAPLGELLNSAPLAHSGQWLAWSPDRRASVRSRVSRTPGCGVCERGTWGALVLAHLSSLHLQGKATSGCVRRALLPAGPLRAP